MHCSGAKQNPDKYLRRLAHTVPDIIAAEVRPAMRCYLMKNCHITSVEFLKTTEDAERIAEAHKLFEAKGKMKGADGFEVWDGPRFLYRYPEEPKSSSCS
jgi:hypothetical protein